MEALVIVPVLFTVGGLVFARTGFQILRSARRFEAVAVRSHGTVTDLIFRSVGREAGGGTWYPVLRFDTADGRHIETEGLYGRSPPPAKRGDEVMVLYDPADPTKAALEGRLGGGPLGTMFVVLGVLFAAVGIAIGGVALFVMW